MLKVNFNENKIENDYHVNIKKIIVDKNGKYDFIKFHNPKSLLDMPNFFLTNKNIVLVYEHSNDNIIYRGVIKL